MAGMGDDIVNLSRVVTGTFEGAGDHANFGGHRGGRSRGL